MKAIDYLKRYRTAFQRVRSYEERVESVANTLKGHEMDGMPHGRNTGKPTEQTALNLAILKEELDLARLDAEFIKQDTASMIDLLKDDKSRELLYSRYVLLLSWSKVAERLDYLRPDKEYEINSVVGYMHRKALREFEEVLNER